MEPPKDRLKEKAEHVEVQQEEQNSVLEEATPVPLEDWQKAIVTMDPVEDWQKEIEGSETEEEKEHHSGPTTGDGQEEKTDQEEIKPDSKENVAHLEGAPPSVHSVKREQPGGTHHLVQVNPHPRV